jgi:hypothetical protein
MFQEINSQANEQQVQELLYAFSAVIFLFFIYKLVKYIWFSVQLMVISRKLNRPNIAWMAWFPVLRTFQVAILGKRPLWILAWIFLYVPSLIFMVFLFIENVHDIIESGEKIAKMDIVGLLIDLSGVAYGESILLAITVIINMSIPLLLYARLSQECNRDELWSIPIRMIPIVNLFAIIWLRWGAGYSAKSPSNPPR